MITKEKKDGMLQQSKSDKPFVKKNFIFMAVSVALIIIGFALMAGPGS